MAKTSLVLGAGGATAWVFHSGVLEAIEAELSLEASDMDIMVGTSAGSSVAAVLRAGVTIDEFYERVTRPPSAEDRQEMLAELRRTKKTIRPVAPGLWRDGLRGGRGLSLAVAGMLPPGVFPTAWLGSLPGMESHTSWPDGLWVPATKASDGEVVVFGKDRVDVPVVEALEASSAAPVMFRPKTIDNEVYIDGGVVSSTHADLLVGTGADHVIISAPMSRRRGGVFGRNAARSLEREVKALTDAGIETTVIEPTAAVLEAARGYPRRRPESAPVIASHAMQSTRLALASA